MDYSYGSRTPEIPSPIKCPSGPKQHHFLDCFELNMESLNALFVNPLECSVAASPITIFKLLYTSNRAQKRKSFLDKSYYSKIFTHTHIPMKKEKIHIMPIIYESDEC